MAFVIGLTGSIGMGKSTTAAMFEGEGAAVWDADGAVHRLYAPGGAGVAAVAGICPGAIRGGGVDRAVLSDWVRADPDNFRRLEAAVHPLVAADREAFLAGNKAEVVVLDIPLLLEGEMAKQVDLVVVVSAPPEVQRQRVLARPGMTEEKLDLILSRQMPDAEKRARADLVIDTGTLESARESVRRLMRRIGEGYYARNRSGHRDHGV